MLQFWKKSGSRESSKSNPPSPMRSQQSFNSTAHFNGNKIVDDGTAVASATLLAQWENESGDFDNAEWLQQCRSRLSMSLAEVIADKGALGYFIQFLEARASGALIRFWLDVECFRSAAEEDARAGQSGNVKHQMNPVCDRGLSAEADNEHECKKLSEAKNSDNLNENEADAFDSASVHCDAVRIFDKYLGANALLPIPITDEARDTIALALFRPGDVDPNCFSLAQITCYDIMEQEYFNEFLRSDFYCKHQIDVLTSGDVALTDILFNQTSFFYFMEFMEQEGQRSLLEFWLAANNFSSHLLQGDNDVDAEQVQSDAIVLYEKYFSLQATCPLGFSDKIRVEVEHNICCDGGPKATCFSRPLSIVLRLLQKNYLQPFLQSQLYFKYLSELITTIQATKNGSDCGSETGLSTPVSTNTLLAGGDTGFSRKVLQKIEQQNLSIDARQLYDPDSLWRRRCHSGLSFGRINELGRFETEVEPEPDKKTGSRITRAMKKLVNMDEDKAKEEMAWQIAEMIVKGVTSLTLGDEPSS